MSSFATPIGWLLPPRLYNGVRITNRPSMANVRRLDMGVIPMVTRMQNNGIAIDVPYFHDMSSKLQRLMDEEYATIRSVIPIDALQSFIHDTVHEDDDTEGCDVRNPMESDASIININSPEQLADLLFTHMGLGSSTQLKTTKNGKRISTGKKQLEMLKDEHPIIKSILRYREYAKLKNTYCDKMPLIARWHEHSHTWRIHSQFPLTRTETGRLACVSGDTILNISRGDFTIEEYIPECGDTITTHLGRQRRILRKFYKGVDTMYRVYLNDNVFIKCTSEHRLLTPSGWRQVGDLSVGDEVFSVGIKTLCEQHGECEENGWAPGAAPKAHRITEITALGPMGVWDIEVEEDHSYWAHGLLHHNSRSPNLMNIPARSKLGAELRNGFIASPGKVLLSRDFSQIELRVLAHLANETRMIQIFHAGGDIHDMTTMAMYKLTAEQWEAMEKTERKKMRTPVKNLQFGLAYGLSALGLQQGLLINDPPINWSEEQCQDFIDYWYSLYTAVRPYMDSVHDQARTYSMVWCMFGRVRLIPGVNSVHSNVQSAALREAGNMPIQASAQGLIKLAMAKCEDESHQFRDSGIHVEPLIQIHDEIIWEVDEDYVELVSEYFGEVMCSVAPLKVPIKSEAGWDRRWKK